MSYKELSQPLYKEVLALGTPTLAEVSPPALTWTASKAGMEWFFLNSCQCKWALRVHLLFKRPTSDPLQGRSSSIAVREASGACWEVLLSA